MTGEPKQLLTPLQRAFLEANPEASLTKSANGERGDAAPEPIGVEGWLQFLAVSLIALGPTFTVAMNVFGYIDMKNLHPSMVGSSAWNNVIQIGVIYIVIYCALNIFAGWLLFKRFEPSTVPIVIALIWIAGPGLSMLNIMVFQAISDISAVPESAGAVLGRRLIFSTIWTVYLLRSRRVRNTYYRNIKMERLGSLNQ